MHLRLRIGTSKDQMLIKLSNIIGVELRDGIRYFGIDGQTEQSIEWYVNELDQPEEIRDLARMAKARSALLAKFLPRIQKAEKQHDDMIAQREDLKARSKALNARIDDLTRNYVADLIEMRDNAGMSEYLPEMYGRGVEILVRGVRGTFGENIRPE